MSRLSTGNIVLAANWYPHLEWQTCISYHGARREQQNHTSHTCLTLSAIISIKNSDLESKHKKKSGLTRIKVNTDCICWHETDSIDGVAKRMTILFFTTRCSCLRASKIASAHYHRLTRVGYGLRHWDDKRLNRRAEAWFVKIVCTLFVRSNSLDRFLGYFRMHLTPPLVLEVIKRLNNLNMGLKFFEFSREKLNVTQSFWTYNMLLRSLCEAGLYNSAKIVYDCMRSDGQLPDSWLFGFLVSSCARAGRFDISKELLAEFNCKKIGVKAVVYNELFNILVNQNKVNDAVGLFREHMGSHARPETCTFNILMRGLCRTGKIDEAYKFLNDMRSFNCSPDLVTYNTLIHGFCLINEVNRARDMLKEVCSGSEFAPNVISYTTIISGYCKLSKMEDATSLFDKMIRSGTKPNTVTFNALIDGFGKVGDMASALAMYEKMLNCGCPPDVVTFTALIDGYCRIGQVNRGLDLWHEVNAGNICPSLYTFSVLISALCKSNRLHEARDLLRQLNQSDIVPEPFIYNPVVDGYCKCGNVDEANTIVAEMEEKRCKPDKVTFTILIIGHCMKGKMPEVIDIFYKMLAVGCDPDDITVNSLRSCLLKAGMPGEAARIKKALLENQTSGNSSLKLSFHEKTNADMPIAVC